MPMLYPGRDIYNISGSKLSCRASPLLIISTPSHADKHLSTAAFGVMDMPVIAAGRLKGHVEHRYLLGGNGGKVALSHKVFSVRVCLPYGEKQGILIPVLFGKGRLLL